MTDREIRCSFCNSTRKQRKTIISSPDFGNGKSYICDECAEVGYKTIHAAKIARAKPETTPFHIKGHLDKYVVEQESAKRSLSVSIYNHLKIVNSKQRDIKKANVLLVGPSGTGKTLIVDSLAKHLNIPIAHSDATTLTESGYVGDDAISVIELLFRNAGEDIEATERGIVYIDEIDKKARSYSASSNSRDVSGEGSQQSLLKLVEGTKVMLSSGVQVDTTNILFVAGGAFVGIEEIISQRLNVASTMGFGSILDKGSLSELVLQISPDDLIEFGMIPEFIGRFPSVVPFHPLTEQMLVRVMTEPENSLVRQYQRLFEMDGVSLTFSPGFLSAVAEEAKSMKTGARGLHNILEKKLSPIQFDLPKLAKEHVSGIIISETGEPQKIHSKVENNDQN